MDSIIDNLQVNPTPLNLLLALTPGTSLTTWKQNGTLERELQIPDFYIQQGWRVTILQYKMDEIPAHANDYSLVRVPHWRLLPIREWIPNQFMRRVDVIRTNQSFRSDIFVRAAKRWNKPIILRCGYVRGQQLEVLHGLTYDVQRYHRTEGWAFRNATLVQVTTAHLAEWVIERYNLAPQKVRVVPNFIDTDRFSPSTAHPKKNLIISVGRLHPTKRFDLAIKACHLFGDIELAIVGQGSEREKLMEMARQLNISLSLPGQIENQLLPDFYRQGIIFLITSKTEGHPKSLAEAMACGLPCVGVDVVGIREIIQDGHNA